MKVLVLNSGSSSLKFQLIDTTKHESLITGIVDGIGLDLCEFRYNGKKKKQKVKDHHEAVGLALSVIDPKDIDAIGHRVVHGGEHYRDATLIKDKVIATIRQLFELAPLHNPPNLEGILACKKLLPGLKQVAVFDTAFHQTIPEKAYMYAIPYKFYQKYRIRKYGFHGTSHKYVMLEAQRLLKTKNAKIITCHLGNGSSIAATVNGKSVDTSMGLTPLQGLMMGTRSGDIDPEIVSFLAEKEKIEAHDVIKMLNKQSGLKGICDDSDVRNIRARMLKKDKRAMLALEMFSYRITNYIGAYYAALDGADAVVFTAGIGRNAYYVREMVCGNLKHLGIILDKRKNRKNESIISSYGSKVKVFVIPTNEEMMIAKETEGVLKA